MSRQKNSRQTVKQNYKRASAHRFSASKAGAECPPSLSELDSGLLAQIPSFDELHATEEQLAAYKDEVERFVTTDQGMPEEYRLGCVVRLDRGFPAVRCEDKLERCEYAVGLSSSDATRAAIGDWVVSRWPANHEMGIVEVVLPRTSDIARWRGSSRGERQTLAANVDIVLVTQALSERELLLDRIARSFVVALDCGCSAAVVLTKADRIPATQWIAREVARVRDVLGEDTAIVVTSSQADAQDELRAVCDDLLCSFGIEAVRSLVPAGSVAMVLGESGAGKSTLLNALLGSDVLETGLVREADDAGRHTTVSRRMVSIPGAGSVCDEPGLRSLPLVGHERGLARTFPVIAQAAQSCRFRDCTHNGEPGCSVREALEAKEFSQASYDVYMSLAKEMRSSAEALDPDVVI